MVRTLNDSFSLGANELATNKSLDKAVVHTGVADMTSSATKFLRGVPLDKLYCNTYDPTIDKWVIASNSATLNLGDPIGNGSAKLTNLTYGLTKDDKRLLEDLLNTHINGKDTELRSRLENADGDIVVVEKTKRAN